MGEPQPIIYTLREKYENLFLLSEWGNIINFILIDVRKPITWSISIIVVSHLSQLCKNIPHIMVTVPQRRFSVCRIYIMSLGSLKRSANSNNIKLLILCYYLHYIFITLLIVEKNPIRIVCHDKKRKNKFQQFIKRCCPCVQAWRLEIVSNNRMNNYLSTILLGILNGFGNQKYFDVGKASFVWS